MRLYNIKNRQPILKSNKKTSAQKSFFKKVIFRICLHILPLNKIFQNTLKISFTKKFMLENDKQKLQISKKLIGFQKL